MQVRLQCPRLLLGNRLLVGSRRLLLRGEGTEGVLLAAHINVRLEFPARGFDESLRLTLVKHTEHSR